MMEDAILEGANPQIAVAAGEGGNMRSVEARVELRKPAAVEYQKSLADPLQGGLLVGLK